MSDAALLLEQARAAAERAYAPYSRYRVGAAVETDAGRFAGCNVENVSAGLTICAERVAMHAAVAAGARRVRALALACVDARPGEAPMPCGACLQVLAEFAAGAVPVHVDGVGSTSLGALLPMPFGRGA